MEKYTIDKVFYFRYKIGQIQRICYRFLPPDWAPNVVIQGFFVNCRSYRAYVKQDNYNLSVWNKRIAVGLVREYKIFKKDETCVIKGKSISIFV